METAQDILVIESELQIRRLLRQVLEGAGYAVQEAKNGAIGLREALLKKTDAIVLGLGLPDMDAIDLVKRLREWSLAPVLVLSRHEQEEDRIAVLDAGADDCLTKPFGGLEFVARIQATLRRARRAGHAGVDRFGDVEIDFAKRIVKKSGKLVHLTAKEYDLLRLLMTCRGRPMTLRQILRELWGEKAERHTHYLRVYVTRLRRKLEDNPGQPRFIRTESGIGYRFTAD